jgi:hypothetical protein
MLTGVRLEVRAHLPKKASMNVTRMHDGGIDRYPAISTSPCVRNGRMRRTRPRPDRPTRMPSRRERRHSARLPPRPDAERYVHTVRDLTFPIGDVAVGIGSHSLARNGPKGRFSPREAPFGRGDAMTTRGRNRDPMPSGTPTPFPHTMRGRPDRRSASAVPVLTVGAGGRNV